MDNAASPEVRALVSLSFIAGLWVLLFWVYRDYRIDAFRQAMFAVRDRLFDEAAAGEISFRHPAYGLLRSMINGFIRWGHRSSLLHFIFFVLIATRGIQIPSFEELWKEVTAELSEEQRRMLNQYRREVNRLVVKQMLLGSPLLVMMLIPIAAGLLVGTVVGDALLQPFSRQVDEIDSAAIAFGELKAA